MVGSAIAIIIETIAHFSRRLRRLATGNHATGANLGSGRTHALQPRRASIANRCRIVVDRAIAIVVQAVANFRRRLLIGIAHERSIRARPRSRRTDARLARRARRAHLLRIVIESDDSSG